MKKKSFVIIMIIIIICFVFIVLIIVGKRDIGLGIDKLGLSNNSFNIKPDKSINPEKLYIYWYGETEHTNGEECNKILIYHRTLQSDILDSYGKNRFTVKYGNTIYEKIGILKLHSYSKHQYMIDLSLNREKLIINWRIRNWYDTDIGQTDTIFILTDIQNK